MQRGSARRKLALTRRCQAAFSAPFKSSRATTARNSAARNSAATATVNQESKKSFIRYGSDACWIRTTTTKYKYKFDDRNITI